MLSSKKEQLAIVRNRLKAGHYGDLLQGPIEDPWEVSNKVASEYGLAHWEMVCLGTALNEYSTSHFWNDSMSLILDPELWVEKRDGHYYIHRPNRGTLSVALNFLAAVGVMSCAVLFGGASLLLFSGIISLVFGVK